MLKRWLPLALCLLAAGGFYFAGMARGALGFVITGAVFELAFWFGLFKKSRQT